MDLSVLGEIVYPVNISTPDPLEDFFTLHCSDVNDGHHILLWKEGKLTIVEAVYFFEFVECLWDQGPSYTATHYDHSVCRIFVFTLIGNRTRFQHKDIEYVINMIDTVKDFFQYFLENGFERQEDLTNQILADPIHPKAKWFMYPYQDLQNGTMTLDVAPPQNQALLDLIERGNTNLLQQMRVMLEIVVDYIIQNWKTDPDNPNSEVLPIFRERIASLKEIIVMYDNISIHHTQIHNMNHVSCATLFGLKRELFLPWVRFKRVCDYPDIRHFLALESTPMIELFKTFQNQHSIKLVASWCQGCFIEKDLVALMEALSMWIDKPTREFAFDFELFVVYNFSFCFFKNRGILFLTGSEVYSLANRVLQRLDKLVQLATRNVTLENVELIQHLCNCYVKFITGAFPDMTNIIERFRQFSTRNWNY